VPDIEAVKECLEHSNLSGRPSEASGQSGEPFEMPTTLPHAEGSELFTSYLGTLSQTSRAADEDGRNSRYSVAVLVSQSISKSG
jgi:hypothetical protein